MNYNCIVLICIVYIHTVTCLNLPACYVKRAPVPRENVKVKWQRNEETGKNKKAYYYNCDEGEIRIPENARKRAFTYNTLSASLEKDEYCPPEQIFSRLNDIRQDQNFEEIKAVYLDIYRWFAFRKKEFLVNELFHKIRNVVKTKHFFFGRVYSRSLRRLFKFANCYQDQKDISLATYYVTWKEGMLDVSEQHLRFAINGRFIGVPEPSLLDRIIALTKEHGTLKVLNSIFNDVKYTKYKMDLDTKVYNIKVLNSTASLCLYRWLKSARRVHTIIQIHDITRLPFKDVDSLTAIKKKTLEDLDEYGMRMVRSVSNAFEHIYKVMQRLEEIPERTNPINELNIGYEERELSRDELFTIHLLAKIELFGAHRDLEQLLRGLFEMVQFLSEKIDEYANDVNRSGFIRYFKQTVCAPYLKTVMTAMAYDHTALLRMKAIHDEMSTKDGSESYAVFLSKNALNRFMWYGMDKFCSLFNYKGTFQEEAEDVLAIITNDGHKYLYRNSDRQIIASTDALTMDLWNLNIGHSLTGPLKCQLVISLDSINIEQTINELIQTAKKDVLESFGAPLEFDRIVNFYFKRYAGINPIQEFHPELLKSGEPGRLIMHPIHKFMCIAVDE